MTQSGRFAASYRRHDLWLRVRARLAHVGLIIASHGVPEVLVTAAGFDPTLMPPELGNLTCNNSNSHLENCHGSGMLIC
jgi:hypothetical protein